MERPSIARRLMTSFGLLAASGGGTQYLTGTRRGTPKRVRSGKRSRTAIAFRGRALAHHVQGFHDGLPSAWEARHSATRAPEAHLFGKKAQRQRRAWKQRTNR